MKKGIIGAIILAVVIFGVIICGFMCLERVPAGYVGVVYNMNGGVDGEILSLLVTQGGQKLFVLGKLRKSVDGDGSHLRVLVHEIQKFLYGIH